VSTRGRPKLSESDDDRCEALTVMTRWKRENKKDGRCPFVAKWIVEGHQFCTHHARCEAVAIGIEKKFITRILNPPPVAGQRVRIK
jgi:hypothetical protein